MSERKPAGDGRTDDTDAIQAMLDERGSAVVLPPTRHGYLIRRPLRIHSDQELVLDRFTAVRLAPGSDCLMLRNADPAGGDRNIAVTGGVWDMDNRSQSPNPLAIAGSEVYRLERYDPSVYFGIGMRFDNVTNLVLRGLTFRDPVTFCVQIARTRYFSVEDISFDFNLGNPIPGNMDGIHLDGGCRFGRIANLRGTTYDDLVALNADDGVDSPFHGPIEDIEIDGIYAEGTHSFVRLLSNRSWVRRVSISNLFGSCYQYGVGITNIYPRDPSDGLFEDISVANLYASKAPRDAVFGKDDHPVLPIIWVERGARVGTLTIRDLHRRESCTGVECVGIARGASVERIVAQACSYRDETGSGAAFLGNEGEVRTLLLQGVRARGAEVLDNRGEIGELREDGLPVDPVPRKEPPARPRWRY